MTDMLESALRLVDTANLLVLDPATGPVYRAIADLALGDEVLVAASGRICFRRVMSIEDAGPPVQIVEIPAGGIGPGTPRQAIWLDSRQPVAPPALPAALRPAYSGTVVASENASSFWVNVLVDGAERIIVENLAVGVQRLQDRRVDEPSFASPGRLRASSLLVTTQQSLSHPPALSLSSEVPQEVPETVSSARTPAREPPLKILNGPVTLSLVAILNDGANQILQFSLPPRTSALRLLSASAQPPGDGRRLGVAVVRLQLDAMDIGLDSPALARGFHRAETGENMTWRWTDGDAMLILPAKPITQTLSLHITDWHEMLEHN